MHATINQSDPTTLTPPMTPTPPAASLAGATGNSAEVYPFDRRRSRRTRVHGEASVAFYDEKEASSLRRVRFIDASVTGLGVHAEREVAIGTRFSLFPDNVRRSSWVGQVVRCVAAPDGDGYRLGLSLGA